MGFLRTLIVLVSLISPSHAFSSSSNDLMTQEKTYLLEDEKNTISIFDQSSPLVVSIDSTYKVSDFFSRDYQEVPAGSGTGFIWDDKGHIITNFHVIRGASRGSNIFVTTKKGKRFKAKVIGQEPRKDIAVLKVNELEGRWPGFTKKIANSTQLKVGQKVLAIGNPYGFDQTLTQGIISALDRSMPSLLQSYSIRGMIQTDASINPGNSGGPLINSYGQLVGMNTAIISGSGSSAGIGFAVPSNTIKRLATQIINHGKVIQPVLGITYVPEGKKRLLQRYYGYNVDGVVIDEAKGNAKKAGFKGLKVTRRGKVILGDVITKVNKKDIHNIDDLYNILSEKKAGDNVDVTVRREGQLITQAVQLQAMTSPYSRIP